MKFEKLLDLRSALYRNPSNLSALLSALTEKEKTSLVDMLFETLFDAKDKVPALMAEAYKMDYAFFEMLLMKYPYMIMHVPAEYQSLELCRKLLDIEIKQDGANCCTFFSRLAYHDKEMADKAVSADARCLSSVNPDYIDSDTWKLSIESDPHAIKRYKGHIPSDLIDLVLENNAASVVTSILVNDEEYYLENAPDGWYENTMIKAIEKTLQAMPHPKKISNEKVRARYYELAQQGLYFDEHWAEELNYPSSFLYLILEKKQQWLESYKIFNLMNEEFQLMALDAGLMRYPLEMKSSFLSQMGSLEWKAKMLKHGKNSHVKAAIEEYLERYGYGNDHYWFQEFYKGLVSFAPELIQYVPADFVSTEMMTFLEENSPASLANTPNWSVNTARVYLNYLRKRKEA